jgi:antitoxin VapB
MALSIKHDELEALARMLARESGEPITQVILRALREEARRIDLARSEAATLARIRRAAERCRALPDRDTRTANEILGYRFIEQDRDERGGVDDHQSKVPSLRSEKADHPSRIPCDRGSKGFGILPSP